ncbi:MAG: nucleotidyltransferase domain-containing protein [Phycisphaeraceae bacterium]|nr:nucleotidyltransferase domain-containing protein [Phycisphaeraceae bacterium]
MRFHSVELPKDRIVEFCQSKKVTEFALFGSILTDTFGPDSDIDVLVSFDAACRYSLLDLARMKQELEVLFDREVDLVEKASLRNPFRKQAILNNMEIVYAA